MNKTFGIIIALVVAGTALLVPTRAAHADIGATLTVSGPPCSISSATIGNNQDVVISNNRGEGVAVGFSSPQNSGGVVIGEGDSATIHNPWKAGLYSLTVNDDLNGNSPTCTGTVGTLNVTAPPPTINDARYSIQEDSSRIPVSISTYAHSNTRWEPKDLVITKLTDPAHGTVWMADDFSSSGYFEYTPNPDYNGTDSLDYLATDGLLQQSQGTIWFTVNPVNDLPTITSIGTQTAHLVPITVAFSVSDVETPAGNLTLTAYSRTPSLIPQANLVFGGSGANRTLTITPAPNVTGLPLSTTIDVTVTDADGGSATTSFYITELNDPPTISITDQTIPQSSATIPFTVGDAQTPADQLQVTVSSWPSIAPANLVLGGSGPNRTLTVNAGNISPGARQVYLNVVDGNQMGTQASFVLTVQSGCTPAPAGLVSWWPGNGNAYDVRSGNGGVLDSGASFTTGHVGQAFNFTGQPGSDVDLGTWFNFQTFSLAMWVNAAPDQVNYANIIDDSHSGAGNWTIERDATDIYHFGVADGSNASVSFTLTHSVWHYLVATRGANGNGYITHVYVDGALVGSNSAGGSATYDQYQHLWLAKWGLGSGNDTRNWKGQLDEVDVYNRSLSASEIQALYNAGAAGKCGLTPVAPPPGLVSWWAGEGNANDTWNNHPGTFANGTYTPVGMAPVGQAFNFTGQQGSEVDLGTWFNYQTFSLAMWVKADHDQVDYANIIDDGHSDTGNWTIERDAPDIYHFGGLDGSNASVSFTLTPGLWHYLVATREAANDGTYTTRVYIDGAQVGEKDGAGPMIYDTRGHLWLGKWGLGGGNDTRNWKGQLDEVDVYNRALTSSEVLALYNAGGAGKIRP